MSKKQDIQTQLKNANRMIENLKSVLSEYQQFVNRLPGDNMDERLRNIGVYCNNCIHDLECEHCEECFKKPHKCECACDRGKNCENNKYECDLSHDEDENEDENTNDEDEDEDDNDDKDE